MANSVTIRTTAPGAKQAAGDMNYLKKSIQGIGSKQAGPLGGLLGGLGGINPVTIAASVGIGAVTAALGDGIRNALEEDKQLGRLDTALKNNVKNWDGNRDAIDQATQSAMDFSFSDDDARESIIKLLPVTKNTTGAIDNMRLAMDIARGRAIDLATATDIVVKANMGNVGALKRMGIELDKGATKTEILNQLQQTYAGQADTYANTVAGKFESAQVKVNDAMEGFGHDLIGVSGGLLGVKDALDGDQQASIDFLHSLGTLIPGIGAIGDTMQTGLDKIAPKISDALEKPARMGGWIPAYADAGKVAGTAVATNLRHSLTQAQIAKNFADNFTDDLAGTLRGNKDVVKDAMDAVTWAIKHPMALTRQTAKIEGALTTLEYKRGLNAGNPEIVAVIDQQMQILRDQWTALTGTAYQKGVNAADALERGLKTFNPPSFPVFGHGNGPKVAGDRSGPGYRAAFGPVSPGEDYIVGENGPEKLHMGSGSGHVGAMSQGGAGNGQMPDINVYIDGEVLFRLMDRRQGRAQALAPSAYARG